MPLTGVYCFTQQRPERAEEDRLPLLMDRSRVRVPPPFGGSSGGRAVGESQPVLTPSPLGPHNFIPLGGPRRIGYLRDREDAGSTPAAHGVAQLVEHPAPVPIATPTRLLKGTLPGPKVFGYR